MDNRFYTVTEIAGDEVTGEQIDRVYCRYYWAGSYCAGKDVLEVACGSGIGLGYLSSVAGNLTAGDYTLKILKNTKQHYGDRIPLYILDGHAMPFRARSRDVIILFEALYYFKDPDQFIRECDRILRPGGIILISTANKDLFDYNPSPYIYNSYGVIELKELLEKYGFKTMFYGDSPISEISTKQKILRPIKKIAVALNIIPMTMDGKKLIKRIVFGKLVQMPVEIDDSKKKISSPIEIPIDTANTYHKVIFCAAFKNTKQP